MQPAAGAAMFVKTSQWSLKRIGKLRSSKPSGAAGTEVDEADHMSDDVVGLNPECFCSFRIEIVEHTRLYTRIHILLLTLPLLELLNELCSFRLGHNTDLHQPIHHLDLATA